MCSYKVEVGHLSFGVRTCLFAADETETDAGLNDLVWGIVKSDERATLHLGQLEGIGIRVV